MKVKLDDNVLHIWARTDTTGLFYLVGLTTSKLFTRAEAASIQEHIDDQTAQVGRFTMSTKRIDKGVELQFTVNQVEQRDTTPITSGSSQKGDPAGGTASLPRPTISLHQAAGTGNLEEVKSNLRWGADVNAPDDDLRMTPLHWAAIKGHTEVVALLLAKGADAKARDKLKFTPLHGAANKEVALLLLAKKVDVNAVATGGMTPLHMATSKEVMALLLENGADINAKSWDGATPLRWAERDGKTEIAEFLRSRGATK